MKQKKLPNGVNIYETDCPILYAMDIIGKKWQLPIIWYIGDTDVIRYNELNRKIKGITSTMLTKCLKDLEQNNLIYRKQYNTIPPTVEYSLTDNGKTLINALKPLYTWAYQQIRDK